MGLIATLAMLLLAGKAPPAPLPEIPPELEGSAAVVLEESLHWTITPLKWGTFRTVERTLVLDPTRYDQAQRAIVYNAKQEELTSFEAATLLSDGRRIPVGKEFSHDHVLLKTDSHEIRSFQFSFPSVRPGSVLELKVLLTSKGEITEREWPVQRDVPVLSSRFNAELKHPPGVLPLDFTMVARTPGSRYCRVLRDDPGNRKTVLDLVCENLPGYAQEPLGPPERDARAHYTLRWGHDDHARRWRAIGDALYERIRVTEEDRAACRTVIEELLDEDADEETRLERIDAWVKTRYEPSGFLRIARGIPPLRDGGLATLLEETEGSPEEIAILTMTLLQEAGLEVHPILVANREEGRFNYDDYEVPRHLMLDVTLGGAHVILDAACRYCEPGLTDWRHSGFSGLAGIRLGGGRSGGPIRIQSFASDRNVESHKETVRVDRSGEQVVTGAAVWTGQFSLDRRRRWSDLTPEEFTADFFRSSAGGFGELEATLSDPAAVLDRLEAEYGMSSTVTATADGRILLRPLDVFSRHLDMPMATERLQPLWFPFPFRVQSRIEFELPPGMTPDLPTERERIEGPGMHFETRATRTHDGFIWVGVLSRSVVEIAPEDFPEARDFARRVRARLKHGLLVRP